MMDAATQPWLLTVSISAWMPAPPVGSAPEKHRTTGGFFNVIVYLVSLSSHLDFYSGDHIVIPGNFYLMFYAVLF